MLAASSAACADYALGLAAFERGDIATAYREFSALAVQGHSAAQYSLAMLYLKSEPPKYARAIPWLEKSVRQGLPESQYLLGMLSLYGVGTAKNTKQGMRWLELASDQGNEDAQAMLAQSRRRGKSLESERGSLRKARAGDARAKETMRLESRRAWKRSWRRCDRGSRKPSVPAGRGKRQRTMPSWKKAVQAESVADAPREAVVAGKVVEILPDGVLLTDVSRCVQGRGEPFPEGLVVFLNLAEPATHYRYKYESGATGTYPRL